MVGSLPKITSPSVKCAEPPRFILFQKQRSELNFDLDVRFNGNVVGVGDQQRAASYAGYV